MAKKTAPKDSAQEQAAEQEQADLKKITKAATSGKSRSPIQRLADAKRAVQKALGKDGKDDDSFIVIDDSKFTQSMPHLPTGSVVVDYIIGGKPNRFGVRPCPGLPKGRVVNLYGSESAGKCLPADAYIRTQKGLQTVGEILEECDLSVTTNNDTTEVSIPLVNRYGVFENTTHVTRNGKRPLIKATTFSGASVRSTYNHPHLVMNERGYWVWKKAGSLVSGDVLVSLRDAVDIGSVHFSADEAYMLGLILADGHLEENRISVTNDDPDIKAFILRQLPSLLGIVDIKGISPGKEIGSVLRCLDKDGVRELLRGYGDCKSFVNAQKAIVEVVSTSYKLLNEIKMLLQAHFGIISLLRECSDVSLDNQYCLLYISGAEARKYIREVGTRSKKRAAEFEALVCTPSEEAAINYDYVPYCGALLRDLFDSQETQRTPHAVCGDYMGVSPRASLTASRLGKVLNLFGPAKNSLLHRFQEIHDANYFYDEIVSVEENEPEATFDFAMKDTHSFVANGFVTHNTTLALTAAVSVCQNGGTVCYVDWEHAIDMSYAASLGIPTTTGQFELVRPETLEKGLSVIYTMAAAGVDLIIIDSVGAGVPKAWMDQAIGEQGDQGRVGLLAAKWSTFLPKLKSIISRTQSCVVGISQLRKKISTGPGNHGPGDTAQGGECWKFYSELRIMLRRVKQEPGKEYNALTHKVEETMVGQIVSIKIDKCKVASSQGHEANFYIKFGEGIDDLRSIIEIAMAGGLVKKGGAWYNWIRANGETLKGCGMDAFKREVRKAPGAWLELYKSAVVLMADPITVDPGVVAEESEEESEDKILESFAAEANAMATPEAVDVDEDDE